MKISMWMIAERLQKYRMKCDIKTGMPCIEGVRFISDSEENVFEERYVYLCTENESFTKKKVIDEIVLINGQDLIVIQNRDMEDVLNSLLGVFDFYNQWESSLWEISSHGSVQELLDKGNEALVNPMLVSDADGMVLAMSSRYREEDLNMDWIDCRCTGQVPTAILGTPVRAEDDEIVSWTETPQIMYLPDGTKTIGVLLTADNKVIGALGLWEYTTPVTEGHLYLVKLLGDILVSMNRESNELNVFRNDASILLDLLDGVKIEEALLQKLELRCKAPWVLINFCSPLHSNIVSRRNLVKRLISLNPACIPMLYDDGVVCLAAEHQGEKIVRCIVGKREMDYYVVIISMPFYHLSSLRTRWQQNRFCSRMNQETPGIYYAKNCGMEYALAVLAENKSPEELIHPALEILQRYDEKNNGDLYHSLYYYLLYERSIQLGANAVHVHRNSFLYRIKRIQAILQVNLNDPAERSYLLFSFLLKEGR